eukprot:2765175-Karenia_brevis.AAC.1
MVAERTGLISWDSSRPVHEGKPTFLGVDLRAASGVVAIDDGDESDLHSQGKSSPANEVPATEALYQGVPIEPSFVKNFKALFDAMSQINA